MHPRKNLQKRKNRRKRELTWAMSDERVARIRDHNLWCAVDRMSLYYAMMDRSIRNRLLYGSVDDVNVRPLYGTSPADALLNGTIGNISGMTFKEKLW